MSNYKNKCGSCARYTRCIMDGETRQIGKCYTEKKGERINLASSHKCDEYISIDPGEEDSKECSIIGCECPYEVLECPECQVYRTLELAKKKAGEKK